ncbi:MAG: hypothetical protein ABI867_26985 [Kofleriaceae bacterium]
MKLIAILALAGTAVIVAIGAALFGTRARARRRLAVGGTNLEEGAIVTITGTVRLLDGAVLTAPLSAQACVAYTVRAIERKTTRTVVGAVGALVPVAVGESKLVPFALVLADRTVIVDGTEAELVLPVYPIIPRKLEREHAFLRAHGISAELVQQHAFEEVKVVAGDKVSVQGMVVAVVDRTAETIRAPGIELRLVAYEDHPLTIGEPR